MPHCIFDKADGKYIDGAKWDIPPYDPATQVHLKLVDYPADTDRLNDTEDGIRPATQAELDADIEAEKVSESNKLSNPKLAFLSVLEILYENNTELQAAFADITSFAQACIDRYKSKV